MIDNTVTAEVIRSAPAALENRFKVSREDTSLRYRVTESIRNAILLGHFKPGDRMPERELCEMTNVSRTLVRESLRQLETEGLVTIVPHKGPVVSTMTRKQAEDVYKVRAVLEGLACKLFIESSTDDQKQDLQNAFNRLKKNSTLEEPISLMEAKDHFYHCLLSGAGNEALTHSFQLLGARIMLLRTFSMLTTGRMEKSIIELEALVRALIASDVEQAQSVSLTHVHNAAQIALQKFVAPTASQT